MSFLASPVFAPNATLAVVNNQIPTDRHHTQDEAKRQRQPHHAADKPSPAAETADAASVAAESHPLRGGLIDVQA
jgi:hypothetical protein